MKNGLFVIALVAITGFSITACDDGDSGSFAFEERGDGYAISKGTISKGNIVIPATYKDKPVIAISREGFRETSISSIDIPASVTDIGEQAFTNCKSLVTVSFAADARLAAINNYVFTGCTRLVNIEIPASVTSIGVFVFDHCSRLAGIEIPAGVTSIGDFAFYSCTGIANIEIPAAVTSVGSQIFGNWTSGQTITVNGKADRDAAIDAGWVSTWDANCDAGIIYRE